MHMNPLLKIVLAIMAVQAVISLVKETLGQFIVDLLWSH